MEACTLPLRVKLPKHINKSEFLGWNLNPVVVLTDIRKSLKETGLETPPTSPENDQKKSEPEPISTNAARQKPSKGPLKKKNEASTLLMPAESNSAPANPKKFKSMKRKRESWDPSVEYEIEKILGYHRDRRNRMLYLVKWKNWSSDHNTLEPIENLTGCHYKLMRYFETRPPTAEDILRKDAELEAGLSRRGASELLERGRCGAKELSMLSRECPDAPKLLQATDLSELEERVREEYGYIVRCLIGMHLHQDSCLVLRGQNYKLLLKLIQQRRRQLQKMAAFEEHINRLEKTRIAIENKVDLEEFPSIDYILELKPGAGMVLPKDPILGCDCPEGCNRRSSCCGKLGDSVFAYGPKGRLRTLEKVAIYECNSRCRCPKTCPNRVVQRGRQVKLCIFKTEACGWGVKALERIPKGAFVCEYVGELIPEEEANARDARCVAENKSSYLFNLDFFTDGGLPMYCIDAGRHGNVSRFINHSCDPNLVVYPVWVDVLELNLHRLAFFARRNIHKGEEIQFDYESLGEFASEKADDENAENRLRCQCNAANCRKWVFRNS